MSKYKTQSPYIASYVLLRKNGKIAFLLRSGTDWMNGYYSLPSGKVEKNESYTTAAIREAKEEVGIDLDPKDLEVILVVHRNEPSSQASEWVDVYFVAKKWKGKPYNAEPHMHSELAWLDPKKLPKNVISSVKDAIKAIESGKKYLEWGWRSHSTD